MKIMRFITEDETIAWGTGWDGKTASRLEGDVFVNLTDTGERLKVRQVLPVVWASAIICIGLNYRRHAKETGLEMPEYPAVFMKNPGAITGHGAPIVIPGCCTEPPEVDFEAELGVVIKSPVKNVSEEKALDYVMGYTCANDVSARRWQKHAGAGQWVKGKSFDTFCPCGPVMVTPDEITDPQDLDIQCRINGTVMQKSNTSDMVFSVARIISYLSQSCTLMPGTLILTGTPEGVGYTRNPPVYLTPGDRVETEIQGIGTLENTVVLEK
ncbi:MAG: fumarylacetoacetate hydrolase family protein [Desulfobacterales bacterium]|nr:fumarylacetoacetate hydrolase family protein [Desulfobacterales bacterium]